MNKQLIITVGLPASGKSTWARNWVNESPSERIRVNRDDIRRMLGPYWIPSREDLVTDIEESMVICAMFNPTKDDYYFDIVVDATNFKRGRWEEIAKTYGYTITTVDFTHVPIETCIERDKNRPKHEQVGEAVIRNMAKKYLNK